MVVEAKDEVALDLSFCAAVAVGIVGEFGAHAGDVFGADLGGAESPLAVGAAIVLVADTVGVAVGGLEVESTVS